MFSSWSITDILVYYSTQLSTHHSTHSHPRNLFCMALSSFYMLPTVIRWIYCCGLKLTNDRSCELDKWEFFLLFKKFYFWKRKISSSYVIAEKMALLHRRKQLNFLWAEGLKNWLEGLKCIENSMINIDCAFYCKYISKLCLFFTLLCGFFHFTIN